MDNVYQFSGINIAVLSNFIEYTAFDIRQDRMYGIKIVHVYNARVKPVESSYLFHDIYVHIHRISFCINQITSELLFLSP